MELKMGISIKILKPMGPAEADSSEDDHVSMGFPKEPNHTNVRSSEGGKANPENQAGKSQAQWQIVHRVFRGARGMETYLDKPRWLNGDLGTTSFQGNLPVADFSSYICRNPNIVFLVFKNYSCVRGA